ncbi:MAG: amidohydrolase family protein [Burkholderiales bacterium]
MSIRFPVPRGAWDMHFHVFESGTHTKPAPGAAYAPMDAPVGKLDAMHRQIGIDFGLVVQSTAAEANNDALIQLLAENPRLKGVARFTPTIDDREVERLHAAGVRGIRFAFASFMKQPRVERAVFERAAARVAPFGWHVKVHVEGNDLIELADWFRPLKLPLVIDHAAHLRPSAGLDQPALKVLVDLLKRENFWVLLCNFDRWSENGAPHHADSLPMARRVLHAAPDRAIWGTDWPHPMYRSPHQPSEPAPNPVELMNLLGEIVEGDGALLEKVLVKNPNALLGK